MPIRPRRASISLRCPWQPARRPDVSRSPGHRAPVFEFTPGDPMSHKNLEELLRANGGPVNHLRNSPSGPNPYPVVLPEYTNWRDEQYAWQHAAILFNQSYHMTDMYVSGPDASKLLE